MNRHLFINLLFLAWVSGSAAGQTLADAAADTLESIKETHYEHKAHVDKVAGVSDVDCSGFVDYLLKRIVPDQYKQLPIEAGHTRPRAEVYYDFFAGLAQTPKAGWEVVQHFSDLRRGDVIAWKKEAAAQESGDTGHVMIVAQTPVRNGADSYRLTVYDSTKSPHDNDTRAPGTNGIGKGDLFFYVNTEDAPVAFQFSSQRHVHQAPIAMGRLTK
jgi:hypothetical protein